MRRLPVVPLRAHRTTPCQECPFRVKSGPGWLGSSSPERFALQLLVEVPLPCHLSLNYEGEDDWEELWKEERCGQLCAGVLIFQANMLKLPHDRRIPRLEKSEAVFRDLQVFIAHHRSGHRSWGAAEDRKGLQAWKRFTQLPFAPLVLAEMDEEKDLDDDEEGKEESRDEKRSTVQRDQDRSTGRPVRGTSPGRTSGRAVRKPGKRRP